MRLSCDYFGDRQQVGHLARRESTQPDAEAEEEAATTAAAAEAQAEAEAATVEEEEAGTSRRRRRLIPAHAQTHRQLVSN